MKPEMEIGHILSKKAPCKGVKNFERKYMGELPVSRFEIIEDSFEYLGEKVQFRLLADFEISCGFVQVFIIGKFRVSFFRENGVYMVTIFNEDGIFETWQLPAKFIRYRKFICGPKSLKFATYSFGVGRERFYTFIKIAINLHKATIKIDKVVDKVVKELEAEGHLPKMPETISKVETKIRDANLKDLNKLGETITGKITLTDVDTPIIKHREHPRMKF